MAQTIDSSLWAGHWMKELVNSRGWIWNKYVVLVACPKLAKSISTEAGSYISIAFRGSVYAWYTLLLTIAHF